MFLIHNAAALIEVDITRGNLDPLPIAVSPLHVDIKSNEYKNLKVKELGEEISQIIENNFRSTGLFNFKKRCQFRNLILHILSQDLKKDWTQFEKSNKHLNLAEKLKNRL